MFFKPSAEKLERNLRQAEARGRGAKAAHDQSATALTGEALDRAHSKFTKILRALGRQEVTPF